MRYADPLLCPDCRCDLPAGVPVCPSCQLLVRHPLAVDLFRTLTQADTVLGRLRNASDAFHTQPVSHPARQPATTPAPPVHSTLGGPLLPPMAPPTPKSATTGLPSYTPNLPTPPARSGVSFASVPKILLTLGAFCLLVAAVIFLAVSWSALGVGGRTAVLVGMTLTAGTSALLLHRAGLRIAGEALIVVALGILALDVLGAGAAGWLGDGPDGTTACVAGIVVAIAATLLGTVTIARQPRLVAPQVIAGIGLLVAYAGGVNASDHWLIAGHLMGLLAVGTVVLGRVRDLPVLMSSAAAAAVIAWIGTAGGAFVLSVDSPDLHQLWVDGSGWSLLVSAAFLLVPGLVARHRLVLLAGASGAAMLATVVLTLPCIDAGVRTVGFVALGTTAAWVCALGVLPRAARVVAIAPAVLGSIVLGGLSLTTVGTALDRLSQLGDAFSQPFGVTFVSPDPRTEPLLLVPSLLVGLACIALLDRARTLRNLPVWGRTAGIVTGVGTAVTLASYDVALVVPASVLAATAVAALVLATITSDAENTGWAVLGALVAAAVAIVALPSEAVSLFTAAPIAATAIVLTTSRRQGIAGPRLVGGLVSPPLVGLGTAASAMLIGDDLAWTSVPVLIAVGVLALALPRIEVETAAVVVVALTFPISLTATSDPGGYTALWLTVAGFLLSSTALLHESRRAYGWAGGAVLMLATWVRLADLHVTTPEAYTLPLAVALTGFGVWRLRRWSDVSTLQALLPGLLLGTVPSLIWVFAEPVSLRALALGAGCLVLTVAGASLRWSAPLVTGAGIGAAVVLRELGPYAGDFPKWVWIGLAGALLTVVGITWERRLLDVRRAVGLLGRLR